MWLIGKLYIEFPFVCHEARQQCRFLAKKTSIISRLRVVAHHFCNNILAVSSFLRKSISHLLVPDDKFFDIVTIIRYWYFTSISSNIDYACGRWLANYSSTMMPSSHRSVTWNNCETISSFYNCRLFGNIFDCVCVLDISPTSSFVTMTFIIRAETIGVITWANNDSLVIAIRHGLF